MKMRELNRAEGTFYLLDCVSSMNFAVFAEGQGSILDRIEEAALFMRNSEPMAGVRISAADGRLFFEDAAGDVEIARVESVLTHVEKDLIRPFAHGPLWRITFSESDGRFSLAVTFHHVIADGRSGFRFVFDLLSRIDASIAGEPLDNPRPIPGPAADPVMLQDRFSSAAPGSKRSQPRPDSMPWVARKIGESSPSLVRFELSETESRRLVDRAKRESVTVHGLVGACQLFALAEMFGTGSANLALSTPADARARLPGAETLELCITLITSIVSAGASPGGGTMIDAARAISSHIKSEMNGDFLQFYDSMPDAASIVSKPDGIKLFGAMMQRGVQASVLSNVGILTAPPLRRLNLESCSFTVHPMITQPLFTTLTTFDGKMHFMINHDRNRWSPGSFDRFLAGFRRHLTVV